MAYSNYAAALAAYVVERVSGERWESYLGQHVFRPLHMTSTSSEQPTPDALLTRTSLGYVRSDLPPTLVSIGSATIHEVGSTGISASGTDMGRFMLALLESPDAILPRASLRVMMTAHSNAPNGFIGLGFYAPVAAGGNPFIGHDGGTGAFANTLALLPDRRFGVFVSYNSAGTAATSAEGELLKNLAARYFSELRQTSGSRAAFVAGAYQPTN